MRAEMNSVKIEITQ